jgi:hypothetical protein
MVEIAAANDDFHGGRNVRRMSQQAAEFFGKRFVLFQGAASVIALKHQIHVRNEFAIAAKNLFFRSDVPAVPCVTLCGCKGKSGCVDPGEKRAERRMGNRLRELRNQLRRSLQIIVTHGRIIRSPRDLERGIVTPELYGEVCLHQLIP